MKAVNNKVGENSELRRFLTDLDIPETLIDIYVTSFSKIGIFDKRDLFSHASVENLEEIGIVNNDIMKIMCQLFARQLPDEAVATPCDEDADALKPRNRQSVIASRTKLTQLSLNSQKINLLSFQRLAMVNMVVFLWHCILLP